MDHPCKTPVDGHLQFFLGAAPWPNPPTPDDLERRKAEAALCGKKVCSVCGTAAPNEIVFCATCSTRFPDAATS